MTLALTGYDYLMMIDTHKRNSAKWKKKISYLPNFKFFLMVSIILSIYSQWHTVNKDVSLSYNIRNIYRWAI